jgi:DNA-binding NtrC family response regulator
VDDDAEVASVLKRVLESLGDFEVSLCAPTAEMGARLDACRPDIVFTDLVMPGLDGFGVIELVRARDPEVPVIVLSGYSSLENAVKAIKAGAFDFLAKPFDPDSVELVLAKAVREVRSRWEAGERARQLVNGDRYLAALVGASRPMQALRDWVLKVRSVNTSVLIEGETGTGKELVARAIHAGAGPFVAVNVAAIPTELAESEFFGHRQGAFTGATQERTGLFAEANGGTLFLDEINAMDLSLQAKLLRVVQERTFRPVGSSREVATEFRLVCATNAPLDQQVAAGKFRRDLFHRINVLTFRLPSLRDRAEDIAALAQLFMERFSRLHRRNLRRIAPACLTLLTMRPWEGNIRELENVIEQAVIYADPATTELDAGTVGDLFGGAQGEWSAAGERPPSLARMQSLYIRSVLERTGGNKAEAARILDIDYKTLLRHLGREN